MASFLEKIKRAVHREADVVKEGLTQEEYETGFKGVISAHLRTKLNGLNETIDAIDVVVEKWSKISAHETVAGFDSLDEEILFELTQWEKQDNGIRFLLIKRMRAYLKKLAIKTLEIIIPTVITEYHERIVQHVQKANSRGAAWTLKIDTEHLAIENTTRIRIQYFTHLTVEEIKRDYDRALKKAASSKIK